MAATDKPYRNQYHLDVIFGVSCIVLLLTTAWMFIDDHYRAYKPVQRKFRDVEEALYVQQMAEKYPQDKLDAVKQAQTDVDEATKALNQAKKGVSTKVGGDAEAWLKQKGLEKAKLEAAYQDKKANYDSEVSLYNILIDDRDTATDPKYKEKLNEEAKAKKDLTNSMEVQLQAIQLQLTANEKAVSEALADQKEAEKNLADAQDRLKKLTDDFDRTAKLAAQKRWKKGDWFRSLPIIDGFASAYKIQQVSLNDLTIEYGSFKDVPRYDRCTTCHLGIERAPFDKATLRRLNLDADPDRRKDLKDRYAAAIKLLQERADKRKESLGFDVDDLGSDVPSVKLSEAQVTQYCAHPRLDLFVEANSPHPLEKFGCTTCHSGQGSATDFSFAAHTPDDALQRKQWEKEHDWEPTHDWEYPMLPARFVESSCLKCHHQVTDLVRYGSKEEAPKLLKGYNLVRENGCFGCHEISGLKAGKEVGPDLRLEPSPALEYLTPDERAKLLSDASNPPGTMRRVGPALRRISEKTNEAWARKWINSPRGFRPDTKMPHFYNLSNNGGEPGVLPKDQEAFPATEISSIAHYLFAESNKYLNGDDTYIKLLYDRREELEKLQKNNEISPKQSAELIEVGRRIELAGDPRTNKRARVVERIVDEDGQPVAADRIKPSGDLEAGRTLFKERGCLACHSHSGTESGPAPVVGEAHFGPNLSRVAEKMVVMRNGQRDADASRRWVIQWILNPNIHHPRTRMPITHLKPEEAAQVADWLLSQKVNDPEYQEWNQHDVPEPSQEDLVNLARVYLKKAPGVSPLEVDDILKNGISKERAKAPQMAPEADEHALEGEVTPDKLKYYIGKKAISRLGCYACHDIPGFETAKPVGTPLNDWGKKDPARIAFEDISAYVKDHYQVVETRDDPKDKTKPSEEWAKAVGADKKPYEKFFADALNAHQREGFLHQKLKEPRSYDYHRDVKWDDRLRMPQFKFAHPKKEKDESDEEFAARADKEEAEAREAVMTFILGLVAEPVHPRYLSAPSPDRLAEVKGRQVIEKFNCVGCHLVRPGVYDYKINDDTRRLLAFTHNTITKDLPVTDYGDVFAYHNAWGNRPPATDYLAVYATRPATRKPSARETNEPLSLDPDRDLLSARLAEALAFTDPENNYKVKTFPAGVNVSLPQDQLVARSDPFGGTFAELMVPYLGRSRGGEYQLKDGDNNIARRDLPPPLYREGERVQPDWLFNFLRNPTHIRPQVILRMPKFNMSDEEAQTLVNYFAAADKTSNPGIGLAYPYTTVREQQDTYRDDLARRYWERTNKEQGLQARIKKLQDEELPAAKKKIDDAKTDVERKDAERGVAVVNAQVKALQSFLANKDEAARSLYWHDAYKLIATPGKSICLDCHRVGAVTAAKEQGPPLELSFNRLRPGWTEHWMANPDRLFTYPSVMPQNFPKSGQPVFQDLMPGTSLQQIGAIRDVLMNLPKVADMPVNRSYREATTGGK